MRHRGRGLVGLAVLAAIALMLSACGLRIPADPDGTLASISSGTLRAGASIDGALVERDGDTLSGGAVTLVEDFAAEHDATVEWTVGSEESLVHGLDTGALQLVVGGMTTDSPWAEQAGMTRGYPGIPGADGRDIVMLVPPGENALLVELEAFLDDEVG